MATIGAVVARCLLWKGCHGENPRDESVTRRSFPWLWREKTTMRDRWKVVSVRAWCKQELAAAEVDWMRREDWSASALGT
ncbi:hypothetical protein GUJ93_ZPchr0011g28195 [Zizania palustris]|uniref:Uncharacterized protein n=1 Tax=Zizania palustris TaxID=103762 RepID=A0A8J6BRV0_ZIZPA|nr:hypothetical protein GUJ93_ZPchr0011g28195 [Zizania palustris]